MWSLVKYNFPSKTWAIPHTPWAALAQITSLGLSSESLESSLEEESSEMGLSSSVSVPESETVTRGGGGTLGQSLRAVLNKKKI